MPFIVHDNEAAPDASIGGKASALAGLKAATLPIPAWFAVRCDAFDASLTPEQKQALAEAQTAEQIQSIIRNVEPSGVVCDELQSALKTLCPNDEFVAVRSSASDEDGVEHSFAGQLDSFLFVKPQDVAKRVAQVWRSGFSDRILAYRRENSLPLLSKAPGVLVQRMIDSEVSGVCFAADPVSGKRSVAVVGAVPGLGSALVSGECDADMFHVDEGERILQRQIANKLQSHRMDASSEEGIVAVPVNEVFRKKPSLTDEQIIEVARLARRASSHFGLPQDIEWAIEKGVLYLLQSRPITTLAQKSEAVGVLTIWDNSNISESYGGVTTPLTFSFALRAYTSVYREFCRVLNVPERKIDASEDVFSHMLGLIQGRIYYNLLNWYRLIALLPGYKLNRGFMEQMMGVNQALSEEIAPNARRTTFGERSRDALDLSRSVVGLIANHFLMPRKIRAFYQRLNQSLGTNRAVLETMRIDDLARHYRWLEAQLLRRWDAPLINDFFAMIFYGVLRKQTQSILGEAEDSVHNNLLCGQGGMISAEPAQRICQIAEQVAKHPELIPILCDADLDAIKQALDGNADIRLLVDQYLQKFGDRCLEELKLESNTLHDAPLPLYRSIGQMANRLTKEGPRAVEDIEGRMRAEAEARMEAALQGKTIKKMVFNWVLKHARARICDRENLRFERTRLFGRVRRIMLEIGKRLQTSGQIDDPRDVFYLELDEILGFIDGTASTANLKALTDLRRREFEAYRKKVPPPDRFETRGAVHLDIPLARESVAAAGAQGDLRHGIGCCPGKVRGEVQVVDDPREVNLQQGRILVAERTDPGWIMLFPLASGLLVERGSVLSHAAIVSREMAIPSVVSIVGLTQWLKTGDWVEMDGAKGTVRLLDPSERLAP